MLSGSEINHIARLAKLRLEPEEAQRLSSDLSRVLDYIALLEQVDVDMAPRAVAEVSTPRADRSRPGIDVEAFLSNAPESLDRFLLVPAVK